MNPQQLLKDMFDAAIASAQPERCIPHFMPKPSEIGRGRFIVIGAGKASAAMAHTVEQNWSGTIEGLVVTRYGYAVPCQSIEIIEASHPVPDEAGLVAAQRIFDLVSNLTEDDTVLCLISGGGSSLLPMPLPGLTLEDKQSLNRELLKSGATIGEMNAVRRHLSGIKGGRLAAACHPARVITLLLSDVPGDDPINIASGPTVPDPTSCHDALDIIQRYGISLPDPVMHVLTSGQGESVKPNDPRLSNASFHIIATPMMALQAAAQVAQASDIKAHILSDMIEGEASEVGKVLAGIALNVAKHNLPFETPCVILSGGETTVTLKGDGRGGRNVECLLSFAITARSHPAIYALMGDTDGVDGVEEIAGAIIGPDTLTRAFNEGIRPLPHLDNNDGHGFFQALGLSVVTGPTLTNVNDFRAILIVSKA
jgi:glycerate 2-kinase